MGTIELIMVNWQAFGTAGHRRAIYCRRLARDFRKETMYRC